MFFFICFYFPSTPFWEINQIPNLTFCIIFHSIINTFYKHNFQNSYLVAVLVRFVIHYKKKRKRNYKRLVWCKQKDSHAEKYLFLTVKYGVSLMLHGCFSSKGPGQLVRIQIQHILNQHLTAFTMKLLQQDNDPKHTMRKKQNKTMVQQVQNDLHCVPSTICQPAAEENKPEESCTFKMRYFHLSHISRGLLLSRQKATFNRISRDCMMVEND